MVSWYIHFYHGIVFFGAGVYLFTHLPAKLISSFQVLIIMNKCYKD